MPRPYSECVLKVVDEKEMNKEEMFKIDKTTIYWWRKRGEETESIKPSSGYRK
jgi:hypothetical protein